MLIIFSDEFKKEYKKIKDSNLRLKIIKQLKKLEEHPEFGKPLGNKLRNYRSVRVAPFRIVYRIEKDRIIINCFDHRRKVYK